MTEATKETNAEAAWLAERLTGIGGSDAPVVLGLSKFKSPYELWAEKSGVIEAPDLSDREWIEWGHRLERVIGEAYSEKSGRRIVQCSPYVIERHPTIPWMFCTPDAKQRDEDRGRGLLQIKTTNAYAAKDWEEKPPLAYQVQLQHELHVTGQAWGTLACLIGGQKLRWFDMEANAKFVESMLTAEKEFWRRVEQGDPPPVDGSESTTAILKALYPTDDGESIALPPEANQWDEMLVEAKEKIKALEAEKKLMENHIKAAIGNAAYGVLPDGTTYSHKKQTNHYPAKEATTASFRVLRRMKGK